MLIPENGQLAINPPLTLGRMFQPVCAPTDVLGGEDRVRAIFASDPGTYLLTDFSVRSFRRTVIAELGLDRYPQLWPDYFGHYRRVVWLAQNRDEELDAEAGRVAAMFRLPLTVIETGTTRLERELERLAFEYAPEAPP